MEKGNSNQNANSTYLRGYYKIMMKKSQIQAIRHRS